MKVLTYRSVVPSLILACLCALQSTPSIAQSLRPNIKQGMPYVDARAALLRQGWQAMKMHTAPNGAPYCWKDESWDAEDKANDPSCAYTEIESCSGTGMGYCAMNFFDGKDSYLRVITAEGEPPDAVIDSWKLSKKRPK